MKAHALIVVTLVTLTGANCASTTMIVTDPPGATVTGGKDNKELGKTPLSYETKMWIWESERVTVKAPGKAPKNVEIKRSDLDALPMVGGICLSFLPPCFLAQGLPIVLAGGMKLPAETKVSLDNAPSAEAPPEGAVVAVKY